MICLTVCLSIDHSLTKFSLTCLPITWRLNLFLSFSCSIFISIFLLLINCLFLSFIRYLVSQSAVTIFLSLFYSSITFFSFFLPISIAVVNDPFQSFLSLSLLFSHWQFLSFFLSLFQSSIAFFYLSFSSLIHHRQQQENLAVSLYHCLTNISYLFVSLISLVPLAHFFRLFSSSSSSAYLITQTYSVWQCDQMARLFFQIGPFSTHENLPNSIHNSPIWVPTFAKY